MLYDAATLNNMFKKLLPAGLALYLFSAAQTALAIQQRADLHVMRVFTESATTGGFYPAESIDCLWNLLYIDLSTPSGRGQLALLMQAKAQNLRVARLDYNKNPDGTCSVWGIHVE